MIHFFSFITHTKVAKIVLAGEPDHSQPFGICWKAFIFYEYGNFSDLDSSDFDAPGILVKGGRISNYPLDPWYVDVIQSWDGVNTEPYFQNLVNAGKDRCQFKLQFSELTDMDSSTDNFGLENVNLQVVYSP